MSSSRRKRMQHSAMIASVVGAVVSVHPVSYCTLARMNWLVRAAVHRMRGLVDRVGTGEGAI